MKMLWKAAVFTAAALCSFSGADADPPGFAGPLVWSDLAPATYQVRVSGTSLCATRTTGAWIGQLPHLKLQVCNSTIFGQSIEFAPNGIADSVIPGGSTISWRIMNSGKCLTVARAVVFGAPAIDFHDCGVRSNIVGESPVFRGADDQTFRLVRLSGDDFQIRTQDNRCWSVTGQTISAGAQMSIEPCDGRSGQRFALFSRIDGLRETINNQSADHFGWLRFSSVPDGTIDRFRTMPRFNLPSADYSWATTANDQGQECALRCAADGRCRSFTWVDPRNRGGTPMCYLKNAINTPVADAMTMSGIVRP